MWPQMYLDRYTKAPSELTMQDLPFALQPKFLFPQMSLASYSANLLSAPFRGFATGCSTLSTVYFICPDFF